MKPLAATAILFVLLMSVMSCAVSRPVQTNPALPNPIGDPVAINEIAWRNPKLARKVSRIRSVNMGNALEAPVEGEWGMVLEERFFEVIAEAGFNAVRIPVKWSAHAAQSSPYAVDEKFFSRVDWVLENCRKYRLLAILNMHHYDEMYVDPYGHRDRFVAMWTQIAERYAGRPDSEVWFELLNEPHERLSGQTWIDSYTGALEAVRISNAHRPVVLGAENWNGYESLVSWLPPDDEYLVGTFHYYHPFRFTHQGAEWVGPESASWLGTTWRGTVIETKTVAGHFGAVNRWMKMNGVPILLGEFGAYSTADMDSRIRWTYLIARQAELYGFGWAYWEFGAGFGVYDRSRSAWREDLLYALIGK